MSHDDEALVLDMRVAAGDVLDFTRGISWEQFSDDKRTNYAVIRAVQIIGEAAWRVSKNYKAAHPEVPWSAIAAMRHRLVHEYATVDLEKVWHVVETHVPTLVRLLEPLLPPAPSLPSAPPDAAPDAQ